MGRILLEGVCLAVADEIRGPICVYSKGLSQRTADRVTMKALIGTISVGTRLEEEEIAILPMQDEGKSVFSYVFPYRDRAARGGARILSLILVADRKYAAFLYRFAPLLYEKTRAVAEEVKEYYQPPLTFREEALRKLDELMEIDVSVVTPLKLKEYLIQSYLSRSEERRRGLLEKTASIARGVLLGGEKVDLVGLDGKGSPMWVMMSGNIITGGPEKLVESYRMVKELRDMYPGIEAFFILDELRYTEQLILPDIELDRTTNIAIGYDSDGRVRLIGMGEDRKLLWTLIPVNPVRGIEEQEELRRRMYRMRMDNPTLEAIFILCEVFKDTVIEIPEEVPEGGVRITLIKRKIGLREKYRKVIGRLKGKRG
ncbi:MAG: hypothetical protein ACTSWP_10660 [Candidatus Freyarchaeota archaeon]|nr:hypothetical protein [Candidatus Freyrarchaeum guaymaensis]